MIFLTILIIAVILILVGSGICYAAFTLPSRLMKCLRKIMYTLGFIILILLNFMNILLQLI